MTFFGHSGDDVNVGVRPQTALGFSLSSGDLIPTYKDASLPSLNDYSPTSCVGTVKKSSDI
jgi:hypothetical protein